METHRSPQPLVDCKIDWLVIRVLTGGWEDNIFEQLTTRAIPEERHSQRLDGSASLIHT